MDGDAVAIIPARGGSKRVPRKNIRKMLGQPLITYTIEAALESSVFSAVVVSTDDEEIAEVAQSAGAEIPFLREKSLADDITPVSAATTDMLRKLDPTGKQYTRVCQLMPNCPLRNAVDVVDSHRQFIQTGAMSQISTMRFGWQNPWWAMRSGEQFELEPLFPEAFTERSQDLPELFCPTGALWWAQSKALLREETFYVQGVTGWEINWVHGMDIDTQEDWDFARMLMEREQSAS